MKFSEDQPPPQLRVPLLFMAGLLVLAEQLPLQEVLQQAHLCDLRHSGTWKYPESCPLQSNRQVDGPESDSVLESRNPSSHYQAILHAF